GPLTVTCAAAQLVDQLVNLAKARCAARFAVGQQATVGVDGQPAADLGGAVGEQRLLLAVLAEARLGHVDDLGSGVGVLQLSDVDVLGAYSGQLVCRLGGLGGCAGHDGQ